MKNSRERNFPWNIEKQDQTAFIVIETCEKLYGNVSPRNEKK